MFLVLNRHSIWLWGSGSTSEATFGQKSPDGWLKFGIVIRLYLLGKWATKCIPLSRRNATCTEDWIPIENNHVVQCYLSYWWNDIDSWWLHWRRFDGCAGRTDHTLPSKDDIYAIHLLLLSLQIYSIIFWYAPNLILSHLVAFKFDLMKKWLEELTQSWRFPSSTSHFHFHYAHR